MKRLIILLISIIFLFSCTTTKITTSGNFEPTSLFYTECVDPQWTIDSICKSDTLYLEQPNFKKWDKIEYFTSDSVVQKSYIFYNDSIKVSISVTENKDKKYSVKMIK